MKGRRLRKLAGRAGGRGGPRAGATGSGGGAVRAQDAKAADDALVEALVEAPDGTRRVVVVDVGANPVNEPPYSRLLERGLCRVVGFEPQPEAYAELAGRDPDREQYFPHAIGAPGPARLNLYRRSGFTSAYRIDQGTIDLLANPSWRRWTKLEREVDVELTALDDVPGLPAFDLLKIDIQGGELDVFRNARRSLAGALAVVTEVGFFPLYRDAPSFAEVHAELESQGFLLHKFLFVKQRHLYGSGSDRREVRAVQNQAIDGDAVYLRDLRTMPTWTDEQLRNLALLAHFVLDSVDLAARALDELAARDVVAPGAVADYLAAAVPVR